MTGALPTQIILTSNRFSNIDGTNITSQINSITATITSKSATRAGIVTKLGDAESEKSRLTALVQYDTDWYNTYSSKGNWDAARFHSDRLNKETLPALAAIKIKIDGYNSDIKTLDGEIDALNAQRKSLIDQQQAINKDLLAKANLSPQQRADLEKQQAELDRLAKESESKSRNKKIIIIGASIIGVLLTIGLIIYEIKRRKKNAK